LKTAGILEVCRGFSRRINAEFGTKDFFEMACNNLTRFSIKLKCPYRYRYRDRDRDRKNDPQFWFCEPYRILKNHWIVRRMIRERLRRLPWILNSSSYSYSILLIASHKVTHSWELNFYREPGKNKSSPHQQIKKLTPGYFYIGFESKTIG
jgi:hypothetical protein